MTCNLFLWDYHTPSHRVRSCFRDCFSAQRKGTERSEASVIEFLSVAHNWKEWKPLIQQTVVDSWILLPSNQPKSSTLQSLGTLRPWMKDKAMRNRPWAQPEQSGDDSNNDDDWDDDSERFKSTRDSKQFSTSIIPGDQNTSSSFSCSLWHYGKFLPSLCVKPSSFLCNTYC